MRRARVSVSVDGRKLRRLREMIAWTQEEAAAKSGYSSRLIRKLERGGPVEKRTLEDILEAYRENGCGPPPEGLLSLTLRDCHADVKAVAIEWIGSVFDPNAVHESAIFLSSQAKLFEGESTVEGKPAIVNHHANIIAEFARPDIAIEHIFVDGRKASVHWQLRDRRMAESETDNSLGQTVRIYGSTFIRFQGSKIVAIRHYMERNARFSR